MWDIVTGKYSLPVNGSKTALCLDRETGSNWNWIRLKSTFPVYLGQSLKLWPSVFSYVKWG